MLKEIKSFFADLTGGKEMAHFEDNDYRVAAAALLVHVATLTRRHPSSGISAPEPGF